MAAGLVCIPLLQVSGGIAIVSRAGRGTKLGWYRRLELKVGISIEALPAAVQEEKRVGSSSKILEESLQCRFLWKRLFIVTECQ